MKTFQAFVTAIFVTFGCFVTVAFLLKGLFYVTGDRVSDSSINQPETEAEYLGSSTSYDFTSTKDADTYDLSNMSSDEIIEELEAIAHTSLDGKSFKSFETMFGHTAEVDIRRDYAEIYFNQDSSKDHISSIEISGFQEQMDGSLLFEGRDYNEDYYYNDEENSYYYLVYLNICSYEKAVEVYNKATELYKDNIEGVSFNEEKEGTSWSLKIEDYNGSVNAESFNKKYRILYGYEYYGLFSMYKSGEGYTLTFVINDRVF